MTWLSVWQLLSSHRWSARIDPHEKLARKPFLTDTLEEAGGDWGASEGQPVGQPANYHFDLLDFLLDIAAGTGFFLFLILSPVCWINIVWWWVFRLVRFSFPVTDKHEESFHESTRSTTFWRKHEVFVHLWCVHQSNQKAHDKRILGNDDSSKFAWEHVWIIERARSWLSPPIAHAQQECSLTSK
jgi:hypothetical protein